MAPPTASPRSPVAPVSPRAVSRATMLTATAPMIPSMSSPDPVALLNTLDSRRASILAAASAGGSRSGQHQQQQQQQQLDPIDFLNKHYTSEAVLVAQLPSLREAVLERMERLDDRISNALQRQSETADTTRRHVQEAKASVLALQHRIMQVKEKASQSEKAVLEITKDMKRLDCAKRHLQRTITTLKRLHMLINAVEQLRVACITRPFPDYKTAAQLVDATRLLLKHFDAYTQKVEPMRLLSKKVNDLQNDLRVSLVRGFRLVAFGLRKTKEMEGSVEPPKKSSFLGSEDDLEDEEEQEHVDVPTPEVMQGGVLLIDALGEDIRTQFINEFCRDQLGDYMKEFEPPSREKKHERRISSFKVQEAKPEDENASSGLDQIEKRFVWFREVVQQVDSKFPKVFPSHWNLQASMARHFLQLTRDHILALLDGPRKDPDANNATILLKALQKTILFEKDITTWLQRERGAVFEDSSEEVSGEKGDAQVETSSTTQQQQKPIMPLIGVASAAFENYMNPYISLEEQSMDEQLVEALEDRTVDTRGERPVFISSTNLFVYIKGSITRCTALTKGNAFFLLYQAFKDSLHKYAQILDGKLPPALSTQSTVVGGISFGNKPESSSASNATYRLPKGEEVTVCHVISTCEYCADTMEALEDLIRDTIDDEYAGKIDMMGDQEAFHDITAKAIRVLVSGLTGRVENALKPMSSTNWAAWDAVGEESAYVQVLHQEIKPCVITVRSLLPTSYFRSFCDKFATSFTSTYYDIITRLKKISEPGTQQLLLDVYNLKTLFLKLPILEEVAPSGAKTLGTGSTIAPAMYTKMVQKQFAKIETLLKLIGTPTELLIDNFKEQWVGGTALEFQIVLSLKGIKRMDQIAMLEKFGVDPVNALKGATAGVTSAAIVSERVQALQDQGSNVAAKVNSDLSQMRQKVDDFRKTFRTGSNV